VVREKDVSSSIFSKNREVGQFTFSSLITAILSFNEGRPLTSNTDLVQKRQTDYFDDSIFDKFLTYSFIAQFVRTLSDLDKSISDYFLEAGVRWFGRETTLVGIFAAAGKKYNESFNVSPEDVLELLRTKITQNPNVFAVQEFEIQRNSLNLAKVNIGSVNKRAIFEATYSILSSDITAVPWSEYFEKDV